MNILLISSRSDVGGGTKHIWDLLLSMEIYPTLRFFIACPNSPPYYEKFKTKVTAIISIPHRRFSPLAFWQLWRFCQTHQIQLIHSHGRGAGIYGRLLALLGGYANLHTFHGVHTPQTLSDWPKLWLDKLLKSASSHFICVAQQEKEQAIRFNITKPAHTTVIHNGVNVAQIQKKILPKEQARKLFHLPKDALILGSLNRFDPIKRTLPLISAFIQLIRNSSNIPVFNQQRIILAIAGDGEEFQRCKQLIEKEQMADDITLVGATQNPVEFLSALDGFVSFAASEAFPLAVLEAIVCHLPLLLSDIPAHREIIALAPSPALYLRPGRKILNRELLERLFAMSSAQKLTPSLLEVLDHQRSSEKLKQVYDQFCPS